MLAERNRQRRWTRCAEEWGTARDARFIFRAEPSLFGPIHIVSREGYGRNYGQYAINVDKRISIGFGFARNNRGGHR